METELGIDSTPATPTDDVSGVAAVAPCSLNWPMQIQHYAAQMLNPDTAIKHEVLRHIHDCIGECLDGWEGEIRDHLIGVASRLHSSANA